MDDFAIRRGQSYPTDLTSVEDHRVVDVLPTREAGPLAAWLNHRHPGGRSSTETGRTPTPKTPDAEPPDSL
nr:hypothetical protein [Streptomyces sp. SID4913]